MPRKPPKKTAASRKPPKNALPRKTKAGIKPKTGSAEPPTPPRRSTAIEVAAPEPVTQGVGFPVVGVGASAGGLEAFTLLLQRLPADTGMAFVLVQHLHPEYESALTEILSRATSMPVAEAADGMAVEPDHIYVIPPNVYLAMLHGILHLLPRISISGQNLPIDHFLRSLAEDQGSKAIGVILSGTASDGVLGLKAIKGEGGITFAQDEKSAKYNGMPHSAITAGCVDFILPPDKIAAELARIARHPFLAYARPDWVRKGVPADEALPASKDDFNKVFLLLRRFSGNDFTYYKHTTIQRRVRRRMLLHKLDRLKDYVRYLQEHPNEVRDLFHDLLINVTSFFRDPEAFAALKETVFPAILGRAEEAPVRIWVPGCASGEEAYSIAITLLEYLAEHGNGIPIQIFATDIDDEAVGKARAGIYPENITSDVSAERLRRYFVKVESGYQINKQIRDMCVFANQNVIKDPPFSRVDLISCRNLMIYLGQVLQKKVLTTFHYALKPSGFLLLGTAESIGEFADLFRTVDPKVKLYGKKSITTPLHVEFGPVSQPPTTVPEAAEIPAIRTSLEIQREADRLIMNKYAPAAVVINEQLDILQFRGQTGAYLEPAPGEASLNILKMAREGLKLELSAAVKQAVSHHATARRSGVGVKQNGQIRSVNIEVTPIKGASAAGHCYVVIFQDVATPAAGAKAAKHTKEKTKPAARDKRVTDLELELAATKEYLQSAIEQQETSNEELRSANEEIQSSNEELQSINEELETAKEELQSTNEELNTVNDELEGRNHELSQLNNDLTNLISSVNLPVIIVGADLRVRRFTPQVEKLLSLIATDVGRPIGDIKPNFTIPNFGALIAETIDTVRTTQIEAQDHDGRWYSVRIQPYRTLDNQITGAVIVFIDIDLIKKSLEAASIARDYAESVVSAMRHPILVLDKDLRVVSASAAYLQTFQVSAHETLGNLLYRLGNGQWGIPQLRGKLEDVIARDTAFDNFPVTHAFEKIGKRTVAVSGRRIPSGPTTPPLVLMQIESAAPPAVAADHA
ncbi:MAG TPA: chemotaxis protein CheB [Acidiferrobacterales bacterium]|nr:chemotaxis protein CheB [Acidiferrobacterales bacterium]